MPASPGATTPSQIRVAADDIDHMGHVNNSIYLRWVEAAVVAHWRGLASAAEHDAYMWVAVRHEIDYRQPALLGEMLSIDTRITEIRRARAWYQTTVTRGGILLVDVKSCWCCIDSATRRLTVIPRDAAERFLGNG
jgi:acyl-CoA thioester hydrolase